MGVGVPKVPVYINSEDDKPTWIDLYERLYIERVVFVWKKLKRKNLNQIISLLLYLTSQDDSSDILFYINSSGGWALGGLGLYDTMQTILPDVCTINVGLAASTGSLILVGGAICKRIAFPHAKVMIHQPKISKIRARPKRLFVEAQQMLRLRDMVTKIYAQKTGNPLWVIEEDLERDSHMSATEAQDYGIVDYIIYNT